MWGYLLSKFRKMVKKKNNFIIFKKTYTNGRKILQGKGKQTPGHGKEEGYLVKEANSEKTDSNFPDSKETPTNGTKGSKETGKRVGKRKLRATGTSQVRGSYRL